MPIRPENRARYPKDWRAISERIRRVRAQNECECSGECGIDHHGRCAQRNGSHHSVTGGVVVLTVAHLDHTPENCSEDNLKAMCQRCHNRYDAPMRRAGIRQRQRDALQMADFFDAQP